MPNRQQRRLARQREQQQHSQAAAPKPDHHLHTQREILINSLAASGENREKLCAIFDRHFTEFQPQGVAESHLVETLIVNRWRYLRYLNIESSLIDMQAEIAKQPVTLKVATQIVSQTERSYQTTLKLLRQVQKERRAQEIAAQEPTGEPTGEESEIFGEGPSPKNEHPMPAESEPDPSAAEPPPAPEKVILQNEKPGVPEDPPKGRTWYIIPSHLLATEDDPDNEERGLAA